MRMTLFRFLTLCIIVYYTDWQKILLLYSNDEFFQANIALSNLLQPKVSLKALVCLFKYWCAINMGLLRLAIQSSSNHLLAMLHLPQPGM